MKRVITRKSSYDALGRFCGQLGTMLDAGIGITAALLTIAGEEKDRRLADAAVKVAAHIEHGNTLAEALALEPSVFPPFVVAMCRVGEQAGRLPKVLFDLEAYFGRRAAHRASLIAVFLYPVIVFGITTGVTVYLVRSVMPMLLDSLDAMGRQVPVGARVLLSLNQIMTIVVPAVLIAFGLLWLIDIICPQHIAFSQWLARIKLSMSVIGSLLYHREMALFTDALGVMIASGVNMMTAMPAVCALLQNSYLKVNLTQVTSHIAAGKTLAESFKATGAVDPSFCQMIEVGETSGTLDKNLVKGRVYYQKAYDKQFRLLATMLEPAVLIVVGVMVGLVVLGFMSILYAIYSGYAGLL